MKRVIILVDTGTNCDPNAERPKFRTHACMMHPSVVCLGLACERPHRLPCREKSTFSFLLMSAMNHAPRRCHRLLPHAADHAAASWPHHGSAVRQQPHRILLDAFG